MLSELAKFKTMATHAYGTEVVQVQPQSLSSSTAVKPQTQVDENGEQILKEISVLTLLNGKIPTYQQSCYPNILIRYLGSGPHCSCIGCSPSWTSDCCRIDGYTISIYVYLTSTRVHIVHKVGTKIIDHKQIALTDITEIKTVGQIADAGFCGLGTQVMSPSAILLELQPDAAKEYLPIYCSCCDLPTVLTIFCNEDPTEFVTALKQCMVTMPRQ